MEKSAAIDLEFKDLDTGKRTAIIRHAVYTSIDKVKDISSKGMFTKSWQENKPDFWFNHYEGETIGSVKSVYDDSEGAYTEVKFGNWTLGNDVLEMASEGVLKGASFGYRTEKKDYTYIKGQRIRKLLEVKHIETSLLTKTPAHPEAGIIALNKAFEALEIKQLSDGEQDTIKSILVNDIANKSNLITLASSLDTNSDLYGWVTDAISRKSDITGEVINLLRFNAQQIKSMKEYVSKAESYCAKAKASDESIQLIQSNIDEYKHIISDYDTVTTHLNEPVASEDEIRILSNFINKLKTA